jgi:CBS domain-containing protein
MNAEAPDAVIPESPQAAVVEARALPPAPVSSIEVVARSRLLTVGTDAMLARVATLLSGAQISLVVVCDASGAVVGVITETILVRQLGYGQADVFTTRADEVMTRDFTTCGPADSLSGVLTMMHDRGLIHVVVVAAGNRPLGVVNARDGLRALLAVGNHEEGLLRDYVMGIGYH